MMKKLLFVVLWILYALPVLAQDTLVLAGNHEEYLLADQYVRFHKDSTGAMDYKRILRQQFAMERIDMGAANFKTSNYWLRFTVCNHSTSSRWLFEILDFGIQKVAFYDPQQDSLIETGFARPFEARSYKHKNFVFDLSIPPGATRTYWVKMSSRRGFGPIMKVRSHGLFISYANKEYLLLGFYYGLLVLIASYNFFLYLSIKDKTHVFYVFYVISIGLRSLQWDGLGFQYLWPSFPAINEGLILAPQLLLVVFSAYVINFLELRRKHGFLYKFILISLSIYFGSYVINLFFPVRHLELAYLLIFFVLYGISVFIYRNGYKPARFFVLGYTIMIISQTLYYLVLMGIRLENNILILLFVYSLQIGFVIETFIFSIALADKMKILKNDKEKAQLLIIEQLKINENLKDTVNRELEHKVLERTSELEAAKTKLKEQADHIKNMNRLLDLENYKLKSNVKEINLQRGLLKALTFEEFVKTFPEETACFRFIEELKWKDGFVCHKCGGQKYSKGSDSFARRCTKCHYIETIKANTIFHNLKFPTEKAFRIIYLILISEKEVNTYELARKLELQQKTCWSFRQKITEELKRKQISKQDIMEQGWGILIKE